ncbi:hypothetical protein L5515_017617 [Caenorhabditis briggsae]|uniref:Transmembrane protein n=1 Tax=Caenorhabditis briggsae TaxID=6238 RepID=A0AAE9FJX5_CAEBR|nr:hypothetical protein L5515_017617 [Caenorhabditis briggsae]
MTTQVIEREKISAVVFMIPIIVGYVLVVSVGGLVFRYLGSNIINSGSRISNRVHQSIHRYVQLVIHLRQWSCHHKYYQKEEEDDSSSKSDHLSTHSKNSNSDNPHEIPSFLHQPFQNRNFLSARFILNPINETLIVK